MFFFYIAFEVNLKSVNPYFVKSKCNPFIRMKVINGDFIMTTICYTASSFAERGGLPLMSLIVGGTVIFVKTK